MELIKSIFVAFYTIWRLFTYLVVEEDMLAMEEGMMLDRKEVAVGMHLEVAVGMHLELICWLTYLELGDINQA